MPLHLVLVGKLTHPENETTITLLFNMIVAGNLPVSRQGWLPILDEQRQDTGDIVISTLSSVVTA